MLRTIIAGLKARTARLVLSSIAIALGVAFVSGTLVLGDAMKASMQDEFAKGARGVDASVYLSGEDESADAPQSITEETLDKVRNAKGVAGADTRSYQQVPLLTAAGKAKPASAGPLASTERLREYDLADGRYPSAATEAAIDVRSLTTSKLTLGGQLTLLGKDDEKHSYTIVGTFRQGANSMSLSGSDHVVLMPEALRALDPDVRSYQLVATAAPGVSQQQLVDNITAAIGAKGYHFQTGEQLTKQTLTDISSQAGEMTKVLLAFGLIALVVAAMVIYNTFTILVAQRTRELALMRCVGASRGQVFRSVLAEALAMGLFASVIGLFGGLGVSALLQKVIGSFDEGGGDVTVYTPVSLGTVLAAFGVGTLITVLAAVLPARKATRVAPVAALRSQLDTHDEVKRTGKLRVAFAVLLGALGVAAVAFGFTLKEEAAMLVSGAGTMLLLAMVLVLGPLLVGPVNRVLGVLPKLLFGVPAKLASANAGRNPKRTAATTAALMIGVTIVSMVTVVATSAKETANAEVDKRFPADYTVSSSLYSRQLPKELVEQLAKVSEVAKASPTSSVSADLGNERFGYFTGVAADALGNLVRPVVTSGSLDRLGDGDLAISAKFAERTGIKLGDPITLTSSPSFRGPATKDTPRNTHAVKVVAIIETGQLGNGLVSMGTVAKLDPQAEGFDQILVKLKDGVSADAGRKAVEAVTDPSPLAVIDSAAETKAQLSQQLDQVLAFIWALIGLAVIIALFGIANTLTLSVLERTRESALLRALGLTRGQLRLMLVVESILMAVMGAAIGLVLGIGFGWVVTTALSTNTFKIDFTVPFGQITVMLLAAVVAAIVAAALPARRAGRTSIVSGMAEA